MKHRLLIPAILLSGAAQVSAQQTGADAIALRACVALADSGKVSEAEAQGKTAESLFRRRLEQDPRDIEALVGAARAITQCLVPSADLITQGELTTEAMELFDRALEIQPDHWLARFILATIAYRSPSFLGREGRAAKELDELLRMQGDRNDNLAFARVFAMRGMLFSRQGKADSARVIWERGAALFPNDEELSRLSRRSPPSDASPATSPETNATADSARTAIPSATPRGDSAAGSTSLAPVQVTVSPSTPRLAQPSSREITRSQVLLTAGGTADVLQSVQLQPGATRVGEGGDVYTRGGDATETSLIVNGGRVLSLSRFEGLSGSMFGAIEPHVIKSVRYSSGGFSVRHGNALSGILEIETDGRPRERQTRAGLSLVQASGTVRAPLSTKVGGWLSGRVSHTGALLETHGRSDQFRGAPSSQEIIGSVIAAPTTLTELRATALFERDESRRYLTAAGWHGTFDSRGENRAAMLSSRWMSSTAPVTVRGTATASSRSTEWVFGVLSRNRDENSSSTRLDAEWWASDGLILRAGAEQGIHSRAERGSIPTTTSVAPDAPMRVLDDARSNTNQVGGYTEAEFATGRFNITTGVRADRLPGESSATFDPRVAISAHAGAWTTRMSAGLFHQGRWRGDAAIPDSGTPSGLPRTASHVVFGIDREETGLLLRAEAFSKRYSEYRAFGAGRAITGTRVHGVDVIAQRLSGGVTGWVGYSWLDAESRLADGQDVPATYDVTHSATASISAALGTDWSVGTTARYGSGTPRTPILGGQQDDTGRIQPVYGALMSDRLPPYMRLDARVMRYVRLPGALLTAFAEVLNVANRTNVSTFTYDPTYSSREGVPTFFARRTLVVGGELMFR